MSATVAAALKRIAVAVFTDKKSRKTVIGLILGIIVVIAMPIAVFISALNMSADMDPEDLNRFVSEELMDVEKAELQTVEDTMKAIEVAMTEKGFTAEKAKEAQALYIFFLYEQSGDESFAEKLSACFAEDQNDEQLIAAVNSAFGTELKAEDFIYKSCYFGKVLICFCNGNKIICIDIQKYHPAYSIQNCMMNSA